MPSHVYQGKKGDATWVVKCEFNKEEQKLTYKDDMSTSMLIIDVKVESVCETSDSKLLMKLQNCNTMLVVNSW